jgi:hypothetical protein
VKTRDDPMFLPVPPGTKTQRSLVVASDAAPDK